MIIERAMRVMAGSFGRISDAGSIMPNDEGQAVTPFSSSAKANLSALLSAQYPELINSKSDT